MFRLQFRSLSVLRWIDHWYIHVYIHFNLQMNLTIVWNICVLFFKLFRSFWLFVCCCWLFFLYHFNVCFYRFTVFKKDWDKWSWEWEKFQTNITLVIMSIYLFLSVTLAIDFFLFISTFPIIYRNFLISFFFFIFVCFFFIHLLKFLIANNQLCSFKIHVSNTRKH